MRRSLFAAVSALVPRRLRLRHDYKKIIRHAWSIRLLGVAGFFSAAEAFFALPFAQSVLPVWPGVFATLAAISTGGAFVTRLLAQKQFGVE